MQIFSDKREDIIGLCVGLALLAVGVAIADIRPANYSIQRDSPVTANEDWGSPLRDLALEAGARSAILAQCGIGVSAVDFAFQHKLEAATISQTTRSGLWQTYRGAKASAAAALDRSGMKECGAAFGLLKDTIRDLE